VDYKGHEVCKYMCAYLIERKRFLLITCMHLVLCGYFRSMFEKDNSMGGLQ
jgi:hypothetical protein